MKQEMNLIEKGYGGAAKAIDILWGMHAVETIFYETEKAYDRWTTQ